VQAQRNDETTVVGELVPPRGGNIPGSGGHNNPVVGCPVRVTEGSVAADHLDGVVAGTGEACARAVREVLVEFDGDDPAGGTGQFREQRRVDACGRADLQDPVAGLRVELFEHVGHQARARRR
jgi:hypothetical protein